jgi:polyhydroxyalkanoate synthesis regulator phasin
MSQATIAQLEEAIRDALETARENAEHHTVKRDRMIVHFTEKALALAEALKTEATPAPREKPLARLSAAMTGLERQIDKLENQLKGGAR